MTSTIWNLAFVIGVSAISIYVIGWGTDAEVQHTLLTLVFMMWLKQRERPS